MFVFSEPSIATICINETVFHEESGCPYGDVPSPLFLPSFFNISIFDDFPFVYSYLIKPFDSKRKHPVLFFRLNCEVPGSLVFFLTVRGLGLCDVIPLSTRVSIRGGVGLLFPNWGEGPQWDLGPKKRLRKRLQRLKRVRPFKRLQKQNAHDHAPEQFPRSVNQISSRPIRSQLDNYSKY